ncbi:MAG: phosphatase PAP2 family protein [Acidimicrobiia bacterium]
MQVEHALVEDHPAALAVGAVLWVLSAFLLVAMAVDEWAAQIQTIDDAVWEWVVRHENNVLVAIGKVFDLIGSVWVVTPVIIVVIGWLVLRKRWLHLTGFVSAMVVSQLMIGPIKDLYERPRPPLPLVETSSWSFPSGHATATAAIAVALVFIVVPAGAQRRNLVLAAALFSVLMASSRVYLRAHWLSDVLAGVAIGAGVSVLCMTAVSWVYQRRTEVEPN